MDRGAAERLGVNEVLPYSDHADYDELLAYVNRVSPQEVYITHGFPDFKYSLRKAGYQARELMEADQKELFENNI